MGRVMHGHGWVGVGVSTSAAACGESMGDPSIRTSAWRLGWYDGAVVLVVLLPVLIVQGNPHASGSGVGLGSGAA